MHLSQLVCGLTLGVIAFAGQNVCAVERQPPQKSVPETTSRDRPTRDPMTPEKAKAAWALEAAGVGRRVGATEDQIKVVADAYAKTRERYRRSADGLDEAALRKAKNIGKALNVIDNVVNTAEARNNAFNRLGSELQRDQDQLKAAEQKELRRVISGTLSAEQTSDAMVSLGTFDTSWDLMADAVAGFDLDPEKQQRTLETVEVFVRGYDKLSPLASGHGLPPGTPAEKSKALETARKELRQLRLTLNDSMKDILSPEQFTRFEAAQHGDKRDRWPSDS